ncbi:MULTISPECIES: hypothetical protein [Oscillatoriales]|uniref:CopG-like ribbon-helix-helix domain-containing protein n=1 Tax=Phormidium nigroviride PCC 7112 TaxID=179408 RepID=K9VR02_9CYAN|nr:MULTISPECIES: hypothetical protein [Oscillatoriales]AFZ10513.1 hypothetical protein Osc7112_6353 [Oscillatoria nigro-viridis PCC 7112]MBE9093297.1 hypothetical protein [Tychonema sp. LEGE 07203]MBE9123239.1 hypothetical protein [Tychonema sp. LEGE 07199]MBE9133679.1 hypothetical protein [Tychonema sp. LEGE 07196]
MTTKRPRTTISFDDDEYAELKEWADSEYRTIPQLVLVFVKRALEERRERNGQDSQTVTVASTTVRPTATAKAKRKGN